MEQPKPPSARPSSEASPGAEVAATPVTDPRGVRARAPDPMTLDQLTETPVLDRKDLGRRERRRLETFERLVEITREVLFNRDLKDVPVADITEAADVGKGTFFNYFESKEQIIPRLLLVNQRKLTEALGRVDRHEADALLTLKDTIRGFLCPPSGSWLTYEQNLLHSLLRPDVRQEFGRRLAPSRDFYTTLMRLGQRDGTVRQDLPADALGAAVEIFITGLTVSLWIDSTVPTADSINHIFAALDRILRRAAPTSPPVAAAPRRRPIATAAGRRTASARQRTGAGAARAARAATRPGTPIRATQRSKTKRR